MNIEVDNFSRRYLNFQWAFYFYFDFLSKIAMATGKTDSEDSGGCLWWYADCADKVIQTGDSTGGEVKTEEVTYVLPHHVDDYWQYYCKYSASVRGLEQSSEEVPSQEALRRFFKGLQSQDAGMLNQSFKRVLRNLNNQYNELEGRNIAGRRFMRNYRNLKLTLNEFERNFHALQEMFRSSEGEEQHLEATNRCLLHVQLKSLMIEQMVQERFAESRVLEDYVNSQGVFAWEGSRLFCASFQRCLRDTVQSFKTTKPSEITLVARTPFKGNDDRSYLALKVALSRLSPLWTSILLNQQGRDVIITYASKQTSQNAVQALSRVLPENCGYLLRLYRFLTCKLRGTPSVASETQESGLQTDE